MPAPLPGEDTDEVLAARCQQGDYAAFEAIYRRWQRPLMAYLYQLTRSYDDAACLSQEVFLKIFNHVDRYDTGRKFSTWMYAIARNAAIDLGKSQHKRRGVAFTDMGGGDDDDGAIDARTAAPNAPVDDRLIRGESDDRLRNAVAALPPVHREIVELVAIQGLSYAEASQILGGTSEGTLRSRMFHALRLMREQLGNFEPG